MACADPSVNEQEQAFLLAMEEVTSYTIDEDGRLVLEGESPLVFEVAAEGG
jgi:heat shock protein HslJ